MSAATGFGCQRRTPGRNAGDNSVSDSIPKAVKELVRTVEHGDSAGFAKMVSYPLQRPYPLRDIENEAQMRGYYKEMVDDSLRRTVTASYPDRWNENGWRGWTIDDGEYIWVEDKVYDVPYISQKESENLDSLINIEINSLPADIREGWVPVLCLAEGKDVRIYRIDCHTPHHKGKKWRDNARKRDGRYRLAKYNGMKNLLESPSELLEGVCDTEGSAGTETYRFTDRDGLEVVIVPDFPESGTPVMVTPDDSIVELRRVYWHELIKLHRNK